MKHDADELLLGFTRAVRAAGVPVTPDRAQTFLRAVAIVGVDDRRATYWAGRATLCSGQDDLDRYDQIFSSWFLSQDTSAAPREQPQRSVVQAQLAEDDSAEGAADQDDDEELLQAMASSTEVLRHRDIAELDASEKARLAAMFSRLDPRAPRRLSNRKTRWHRGEIDAHRTLRRTLSRMGEPARIAWQRRAVRGRRVVLLVDVSGSMSAYADALLRLAHRFTQSSRAVPGVAGRANGAPRVAMGRGLHGGVAPRVEVFTIGTRLTHITRAMRLRDPQRAIIAAGETVPDWSGGTRLGETLKVFLDRWGQRGMARGSVVVLFSDGWERGDADLLAEQMRRLHQLAHRVVWVNPHRGKEGYQPVQQGIVAALPHVDDFVAGHSMATFAELIEVVARA